MPKILFICTANLCRSPMASALMKEIVRDQSNAQDWIIESAGTWGNKGYPAVEEVQMVMKDRGIDLSDHRSRIVTKEIIQTAGLILTMEKGHKEALRIEFPEYSDRIFLLSEMVGKNFEIDDPIGGPIREYEQTARLLEKTLSQGFEKITQLVET